jgi:hypothetical protein
VTRGGGRKPIEGPVHYHATDSAGAKGVLRGFSSGDHGPDVQEVDATATALDRSQMVRLPTGQMAQLGPQTVILLHDQNDTRLGYASIEIEDPDVDFGTFINVYGREKGFQGRPLADDTTTIGDAVIRALIEESTQATPGDAAPAIYAFTRPENTFCHAVLRRSRFENQGGLPGVDWANVYTFPSGKTLRRHHQQLWRRYAGLDLPPLSEEVYLGRLPL